MQLITLADMTEAQFLRDLPRMIEDFAKDKVENHHWAPENALQRSKEAHESLLPQGIKTPYHHHRVILHPEKGWVGRLWYHIRSSELGSEAYLYSIEIYPEFRRQGFAGAAIQELEKHLKTLHIQFLALHVFGMNTGAQALYEKIGFQATSVNMMKKLDVGHLFE